MAYLGNTPAARFSAMEYQDLTGVTGSPVKRGFTLSHSVGSENEIEVFVNNVRQEPSVAYTVSGTALTMTGDVETTDDFYVVFQGLAQQTVTHPSGNALQATTGTFSGAVTASSFSGDGSSLTGITAGSEYFQVNLTTDQTGLTSQSGVFVDFGGSGTVEYDTASNFDSANDCYLLDSSNGVYIISYSLGIRSPTITTEILVCASAALNIATDGSTYSPYKGNGMQIRGDAGNDGGSFTFTNSFIYKATTATTKIKLAANATTVGSANWMIETQAGSMIQDTDSAVTAAHVTFMSVMRIA